MSTPQQTPRRIPTDEIEVGRWYRVEDAVPADDSLPVEELCWRGRARSRFMTRAVCLEDEASAWRYNGPIPSELPPREEKPKRFQIGRDPRAGSWYVTDADFCEGPRLVETRDKGNVLVYCALLNAGHEALEGGAE